MTKRIAILILTFVSINVFGQNAAELNEQSKKLIAKQNYAEAIPILIKASELGNAEAQFNLAYCYQAGIELAQNDALAAKWCLKSANQGYAEAQHHMMMAYALGNGVEQNYEQAFAYALKCAEQENEACMFNVINCYKDGIGTESNINKMLEWAIRLAKLDNPKTPEDIEKICVARLNLAYMHRDGNQIERDLFKSYQWFLIFNEFKKEFAPYFDPQEAVQEIRALETELTAEQKANGQKEAEKLFGKPLKNMENLYKAEY
ncbi:tetratricopeptide repeat protein [Bacteroidota bacterium]